MEAFHHKFFSTLFWVQRLTPSQQYNQKQTRYCMPGGIIRLDEGWHLDDLHHLDQSPFVPLPIPVVLPALKNKGKHMDFISDKRTERYLWLKNLSLHIVEEAVKMGLSAADALAIKAMADALITKMEATDDAQAALDGARSAEKQATTENISALRLRVRNMKTLPGYPASGSEGVLQLKGPVSDFDASLYKPVLKVSLEGGHIRVEFAKKGVDAMAVYCRLRGTVAWTKIGTDSGSPYYDTKPLANANVPEVREYLAMGVIDDVEIGLPSDIVSITLS